VVVAQQAAEPLAANDLTCACSSVRELGFDDLAIDALTATFRMVVRQVLPQHAAHVTLVEQDEVVDGL
jgi:hypothetical protein